MPQTLTEISNSEIKRRLSAAQYERLLGVTGKWTSAIPLLEANVAKLRNQLKLLDTLDGATAQLDPKIDVGGRIGLLRYSLIGMLAVARDDQARRLADQMKMLTQGKEQMASALEELKTFEG